MLRPDSDDWFRSCFFPSSNSSRSASARRAPTPWGRWWRRGRFLDLAGATSLPHAGRLTVRLHGSLAFTGKGHGTDRAVILGLAGERPDTIDPDRVDSVLAGHGGARPHHTCQRQHRSLRSGQGRDLRLSGPPFPAIPMAWCSAFSTTTTTRSSPRPIIPSAAVSCRPRPNGTRTPQAKPKLAVPYPFSTAAEMLEMGKASGLSVAEMKRANETVAMSDGGTRCGPRPHLGCDECLHEPRPRLGRHAARRPERSDAAPPKSCRSSRPSRAAIPCSRTGSWTGFRSMPWR